MTPFSFTIIFFTLTEHIFQNQNKDKEAEEEGD